MCWPPSTTPCPRLKSSEAASTSGTSALSIPSRTTPLPVPMYWVPLPAASRTSTSTCAAWSWNVVANPSPPESAKPAWVTRYAPVTWCCPAPWGRWSKCSPAISSRHASMVWARSLRSLALHKRYQHEQHQRIRGAPRRGRSHGKSHSTDRSRVGHEPGTGLPDPSSQHCSPRRARGEAGRRQNGLYQSRQDDPDGYRRRDLGPLDQ